MRTLAIIAAVLVIAAGTYLCLAFAGAAGQDCTYNAEVGLQCD